jgi:hypothetical protein
MASFALSSTTEAWSFSKGARTSAWRLPSAATPQCQCKIEFQQLYDRLAEHLSFISWHSFYFHTQKRERTDDGMWVQKTCHLCLWLGSRFKQSYPKNPTLKAPMSVSTVAVEHECMFCPSALSYHHAWPSRLRRASGITSWRLWQKALCIDFYVSPFPVISVPKGDHFLSWSCACWKSSSAGLSSSRRSRC